MKEIMKNMDELKDKLFTAIDTICKDYEAKAPEFKVGQWVYWHYVGQFSIIRIVSINDIFLHYDEKGNDRNVLKENCRPATPQEIESHLRKICDEKYIGRKVKSLNSQENRDVVKFNEYCFADDTMFYYDLEFGYLASVYCKGEFAEIIPDKKKLPKTKQEFNLFLGHWNSRHTKTTGEFLNEYED